MSDFFRIPLTDLSSKTLRQLAELCHEVEDVLLLNVQAEVTRRNMGYAESPFMEFYRIVWKERMDHAAR